MTNAFVPVMRRKLMTKKQIIIDGCEFQSDCIEYKDISYLKIMPICAIHELSIACRDKVNKCKYYTLYKQLKAKEQECEELKHEVELMMDCESCKIDEYKQTLTEIKDMCSEINCESLMQNYWCGNTDFKMGCCEKLFKKQILQKISGVENE